MLRTTPFALAAAAFGSGGVPALRIVVLRGICTPAPPASVPMAVPVGVGGNNWRVGPIGTNIGDSELGPNGAAGGDATVFEVR